MSLRSDLTAFESNVRRVYSEDYANSLIQGARMFLGFLVSGKMTTKNERDLSDAEEL